MDARTVVERELPADYEARVLTVGEHTSDPEPAVTISASPALARSSQGRALLVHVAPREAEAWVGRFTGAEPWADAIDAVAHTPHPHRLLVSVSGVATLVDVRSRQPIPIRAPRMDMVCGVLASPAHGLLLLATPWEIVALDQSGVRWVTRRLSIEQVRMDAIHGDLLRGTTEPDHLDLYDPERAAFRVDLRTGLARGGMHAT